MHSQSAKKENEMEKIVYAYWLCYEWQELEEGKLELRFEEAEDNLANLTFLGNFTIQLPAFKVPMRVEVNANRIKHLRIQKEAIQAKAFIDTKAIDDKIQNLLALPAEV